VLAPKWWSLHVTVLVAVLVMLRLGLWQWHRANSASGGIQNYAYAFQWPVFAVLAVVLWVRTLQEELRRDDRAARDGIPDPQRVEADIVRRPGFVIGVTAPTQQGGDADDPEVAAWNARLAALNAASAAVERRRRSPA
jgi:DNA-binding transcriptional regulator of glucitol operon